MERAEARSRRNLSWHRHISRARGGQAASLPDQSGRVAVVTGANQGLGLETARALALRGATVLLACRDLDKAERAAALIRAGDASAKVQVVRLDLASLASIREAATTIRALSTRLDLLINNVGVMEIPLNAPRTVLS
ncbi:SDR family NAD(P)-dependent oxidoreductase [Ktedonosporobacter rubrisoli]|uniref:SDR family NAD(P)-dependent oxidoreductase n=1 Tax=Ktedonosporobacter rubrisoli TaxID=2509675 RepID=UPI001A91182D|nr:SDR family NAD(P)-dependent oxidoreductase [Ktedonosporobacter rubrisoli]